MNSEVVFEILKVAVMLAALLVSRYIIPWIKSKADAEKLALAAEWTGKAVLSVQQVLGDDASGAAKKNAVAKFLADLMAEKNIHLTTDQIETLIEAAVKEMKMQDPYITFGSAISAGTADTAAEAET